jgi:wee1-like protein kinase
MHADMEEEGGSAHPSAGLIPAHPGRAQPLGNPYAPPGGRRVVARVHSPPCYRTIFTDVEAEADFAAWRVPRLPAAAAAALSRFRAAFKEIGMLGQGNYSKVFRVRHRLDGREYAVKRTIREAAPESPEFALWLQEVQVMAHTPPHPNLVRYHAAWAEPGAEGGERLFVQLELCDVALAVHASLGERLRERALLEVLRQVAAGLAHLHAHGVAHMDVKPDNIYALSPPDDGGAEGGGAGAGLLAPGTLFKLGDFGQATRLGGGAGVAVNEGDSRYLPLEVLNDDHSSLDKADMFALGATLFELASGAELPEGGKAYQDLRAGRVPLLPAITTPLHAMIRYARVCAAAARRLSRPGGVP